MNKPKFEVNQKTFYTIGKYSFIIVGLMGILNVMQTHSTMTAPTIVSTLANSFFYFTLSAFFWFMQGKEDVREISEGDIVKMNNALKELNLEEDNNAIVQKERNAKK